MELKCPDCGGWLDLTTFSYKTLEEMIVASLGFTCRDCSIKQLLELPGGTKQLYYLEARGKIEI